MFNFTACRNFERLNFGSTQGKTLKILRIAVKPVLPHGVRASGFMVLSAISAGLLPGANWFSTWELQ